MAIKNFLKKDTYSVISNVSINRDNVNITLDIYEDESKKNKITVLNYSLNKGEIDEKIESFVKDLSEFKEDEGMVFLMNSKEDKQGFHEFTKKSVKGEKNSFPFIRESLHKNTPQYVMIKGKVYEYFHDDNQYKEKTDLRGTSVYFENYFPIIDKNHFELAYNYLMSLPEFQSCEKV